MSREDRQRLLAAWLHDRAAVVVACFGVDADLRRMGERDRKRRHRARLAAAKGGA